MHRNSLPPLDGGNRKRQQVSISSQVKSVTDNVQLDAIDSDSSTTWHQL